MLKDLLMLFSLIMLSIVGLGAKVDGESKSYEKEERECFSSEEGVKQPPAAYRKHRSPRYYRYCYYWNRDIDGSWPSKIEDSFYDYLRN